MHESSSLLLWDTVMEHAASAISLADVIGDFPYRMALAGGWIDQPFVSRLNPAASGSMVVVSLEPTHWYMERAGMATGTRKVALALWGRLPQRDAAELVRELYAEENRGRSEPSGSQDMIGLIYPGINRLDFDIHHAGGIFPRHIESTCEPDIIRWLEQTISIVPIAQRPAGYNPLGVKQLDPSWIERLGQSGRDCYDAILACDAHRLGASMNDCMRCWEALLPQTVRHATLAVDLLGILGYYQSRFAGAMYSGCGGGYLYVVSQQGVAGGFRPTIRVAPSSGSRPGCRRMEDA